MEEDNLGERIKHWPCLAFRHGPQLEKLTLCPITNYDNDPEPYVVSVPKLKNKEVRNCCYGWLIVSEKCPPYIQIALWNFADHQYITVPDLHLKYRDGVNACILSLPPSSLDSKLFVFDRPTNTICFFCLHRGNKQWFKHCYKKTIKAMNEEEGEDYEYDYLYTPMVTSEGILYALTYSRQILVRIEIAENFESQIDRPLYLQPLVRLPCPIDKLHLRDNVLAQCEIVRNLVESCGEIFAFSVSFRNRYAGARYGNETIDVEIYKLDVGAYVWERVSSTKDQAFFICSTTAFSCSALCSGVRGNCIYFARKGDRNNGDAHLYLYDIEEGALSVTLPSLDLPTTAPLPMWIRPDIRSTDSNSQALLIDEKEKQDWDETSGDREIEENNSSGRNLLDFPLHVLKYISEKLNYFAYRDFGSSSTMCRKVAPSLETNHFVSPWLLYFNKSKGSFNIMGSKRIDRYLIRVPESLKDATICQCKYGWLLMCKYTHPHLLSLYFVNPFTNTVIRYPDLSSEHLSCSIFGFSSPPSSPSCVVIVVVFIQYSQPLEGGRDRVGVNICPSREDGWTYFEVFSDTTFVDRHFSDPIFANGAFYFMSQYGELGILRLEGEFSDWTVLVGTKRSYIHPYQGFLTQFNGEIFSFFINDTGKWLVFKFNRSALHWNRINSLGKHTMYVSRLSSILIEADSPDMEDKIIFSRFCEKDMVSVCLKTGKIYYSERDSSLKNLYGTNELVGSCWIQPK